MHRPHKLTPRHLRRAPAVRSPSPHPMVDIDFVTPYLTSFTFHRNGGFGPISWTHISRPLCSLHLHPKLPKPKSGARKTAYHPPPPPPLTSSADVSYPLLTSLTMSLAMSSISYPPTYVMLASSILETKISHQKLFLSNKGEKSNFFVIFFCKLCSGHAIDRVFRIILDRPPTKKATPTGSRPFKKW